MPFKNDQVVPEGGGDGDDGNEDGPPNQRKCKFLAQREYYAYRLHTRQGEADTLFHGGKLFQQFVVDAWAAVDQNRLNFLRKNQDLLRADIYKGLADHIAENADADLNQLGQRFILPASYTGGTRSMRAWYQDSMSIVRAVGHPDLFLTMTCNPKWKEITEALLPGQTASDRPDIVARVFRQKVKALMEDIYKNGIFGHTVAHIHTIEFQKHGLPHIHLIIFLHPEHKL